MPNDTPGPEHRPPGMSDAAGNATRHTIGPRNAPAGDSPPFRDLPTGAKVFGVVLLLVVVALLAPALLWVAGWFVEYVRWGLSSW